jgi:hypothetical protein
MDDRFTYIVLILGIVISLMLYIYFNANDLAFSISAVILIMCLLVLRTRNASGKRLRENFEDSVAPTIDLDSYKSMWDIGDHMGNIIRPSLDYLVKAFKGETSSIDMGQYTIDEGVNDEEYVEEEYEENPLDKILVAHLKTKNIDPKSSPEVVDKYNDLNLVLSLLQRTKPDSYAKFVAKYGG